MRRAIGSFLLILTAVMGFEQEAQALTLQQIKDAVDAKLATLQTALVNFQDNYYAANGCYWQGHWTHSVKPADGSETLPDVGTSKPTGINQAWPLALRTNSMPMRIRVEAYKCSQGHGYRARVEVTVGTNTYFRVKDYGPEGDNQPWAKWVDK
jgi:hypothetical protein